MFIFRIPMFYGEIIIHFLFHVNDLRHILLVKDIATNLFYIVNKVNAENGKK